MQETLLNTEVLIVGAGPTGLMAANQLQRYGIRFIVIDAKPGPTQESRAIAVTARSLEIYQQMGLSDKVLERGAKINSFNVYLHDHKKAEIKIGEIGVGLSDFHFLFAFEQSKNEELLYENLLENDGDVLWNTSFVELEQSAEGVEVNAIQEGHPLKIQAQWLIGCDGAKSPVRHQLNVGFDGGTYENKFFVADTILRWPLEHDRLVLFPSRKIFCGFFPLQGRGAFRVLGTLPKSFQDRDDISFDELKAIITDTVKLKIEFEQLNWFSVYRLHHRCVDSFREGRVLLAGDSAHIHSPAGGQGMNTGLQDAYNLAWKLAYVIRQYAPSSLLDTYHEERWPFARWLMKFTDRAFAIMTGGSWWMNLFRKYLILNVLPNLFSSEKRSRKAFETVSQIWYSYKGKSLAAKSLSAQNLSFHTGDRLPFAADNYYLRFTSPCFHVLHIGHQPVDPVSVQHILGQFPFQVGWVEDSLHDGWQKLGVSSELLVLVRPDNYIAMMADGDNAAVLKTYFDRHFKGLPARG